MKGYRERKGRGVEGMGGEARVSQYILQLTPGCQWTVWVSIYKFLTSNSNFKTTLNLQYFLISLILSCEKKLFLPKHTKKFIKHLRTKIDVLSVGHFYSVVLSSQSFLFAFQKSSLWQQRSERFGGSNVPRSQLYAQ